MGRSFFLFVTIHAFDSRTDGQTEIFLMAAARYKNRRKLTKKIAAVISMNCLPTRVGQSV